MRRAVRTLPSLILVAWGTLYLPGPTNLELYDVQDLVYDGGYAGVAISLATSPHDLTLLCGDDLAEHLAHLVPGSGDTRTGHSINFQNGLLILRAPPVQQKAVHATLLGYRAAIRTYDLLIAQSRKIVEAITTLHSRWAPRRLR